MHPLKRRLLAMPRARYVLCLSSVDYRSSMGGLGRYLREEMALLRARGVSTLGLFPFPTKRSQRLARHLANYWGVTIDGQLAGFYDYPAVLGILAGLGCAGQRLVEIQIHHLKDFQLGRVADLLAAVPVAVKLFLHDYYTVCPGAHLLRNGQAYCGAERPAPGKCTGCVNWTPPHHARIRSVLEGIRERLTVVAPSAAAREIWLSTFGDFRALTEVVPHLQEVGEIPNSGVPKAAGEPVRVAYVGAPVPYKGWDVFRQLAAEFGSRPGAYEFYHFGLSRQAFPAIRNVPVSFVADGLDAMTQAIRKAGIDLVLLWALWPETYSYTLYESWMANPMLITNPDSGNIADEVASRELGKTFRTAAELQAYFRRADQVRADIDDFRRRGPARPARLVPNPAIPDGLDLSANPALPPAAGAVRNAWHVELLYHLKLLKQKLAGP